MTAQQKKELQIFFSISFLLLAFGCYVLYGLDLANKVGRATITIEDIEIYCYDGGCTHRFISSDNKIYEIRLGRYDNKRETKLINEFKIGSTFNIKYQGQEQFFIFRKIYPLILKIEN